MHYIPYSRQDVNGEDIKNFCLAENLIACANGTAALHISLLAMEIGKGNLVWTSPISFVESANSALYVGAEIDFVDTCLYDTCLYMEYYHSSFLC